MYEILILVQVLTFERVARIHSSNRMYRGIAPASGTTSAIHSQ